MADETEIQEVAERVENHAEPRVYELGFHLDGELPQEEVKKAYQSLKDLVTKGSTLIAEGEPTKVQLAYTISRMSTAGRHDFNTSFFGWLVYEADGAAHTAVMETIGEDLRVIRFIDLRTSKEAAKHSEEMHEFYSKLPEASVEEDSAEVELDSALKEAGAIA